MQIANNLVASIHYTLTNAAGEKIDSSIGAEPLGYLHGIGNIIPGLENALEGKKVGDTFTVDIAPEDAYGERSEEMTQVMSREVFQGIDEIEVGMQFTADSPSGVVTVTAVDGDDITIDGNHPLAGEALNFDVEVVDVREATADELANGHVHGAGCNHD